MADPAHGDTAGPPESERADLERMLATAALAAAAAVTDLAARPDDDAARRMAGVILSVLESLGRRLEVDDAFIEAERNRAVAEDRAAWPRGRGYPLRAV